MLKLLLQGEGPTDCGTVNYQTGETEEGPIQIYIRKILDNAEVTMDLLPRADMELSVFRQKRPRLQPRGQKLKGHGIRAYLLSIEALRKECDGAVLYVDADKESGIDARKEFACQKRYEEIKKDILHGFQAKELRGVAAIPMKMIESWMMGDKNALQKAFGQARQPKHKKISVESFPSSPELEWGSKNDGNSNYPKNQLHRILIAYNREPSRETFCEIAQATDIEILRKNCPISFNDFYEQLKTLQEDLSHES